MLSGLQQFGLVPPAMAMPPETESAEVTSAAGAVVLDDNAIAAQIQKAALSAERPPVVTEAQSSIQGLAAPTEEQVRTLCPLPLPGEFPSDASTGQVADHDFDAAPSDEEGPRSRSRDPRRTAARGEGSGTDKREHTREPVPQAKRSSKAAWDVLTEATRAANTAAT